MPEVGIPLPPPAAADQCHCESESTDSVVWVGWRCAPAGAAPDLEFVHINEMAGGPETAAHLLTFDSVHGRWDRTVEPATPDPD